LGGEPTAEPEGKAEKGQEIRSIFSFDSKLEDDTIDAYNQFILVCRDNGDSSSVKIFEVVVDEEQAHFNYFDTVSDHIQNLGETYLAKIAGTSSATGLQTRGFVAMQGALDTTAQA